MSDRVLRVAHLAERTRALGPGTRSVVWVQGCPFRCKGCVAPETLDPRDGTPARVSSLARRLLAVEGADGVTLSGGEPFAQAKALAALVDRLRAGRPELSVMAYTGWSYERLRDQGTSGQRALLERVDILVDGPYVKRRHTPLRWRGSDNQRLLFLTDRHADERDVPDRSVGLEVTMDEEGALSWIGVPPVRGFRGEWLRSLRAAGLDAVDVPTRSTT